MTSSLRVLWSASPALACAGLVLGLALPAAAEVVVPPPEDATAAPAPRPRTPTAARRKGLRGGRGHQGQVLASLRAGLGLRAIVPYEKGTYCGTLDAQTGSGNAPVCSGRAPFSLDLELGYGVAPRIDLFLETRLGLEADFRALPGATEDGPAMFHLSPGARFYFSDSDRMKLFTTAQLVLDLASYQDPSGTGDRGADLGLRNMSGLWFDLGDRYGAYAYIGETMTVMRWFRIELEAGVGIQGRYP